MLECTNCSNKQETGKFCGACGGALTAESRSAEPNTHTPSGQQAPVNAGSQQQAASNVHQQPNQTADTVKRELSNYWNYFSNLVKNPTAAFHTSDGQFINAIITLIIFALASSLSVYSLANSMANSMFGGTMGSSLPFFSFTLRLLFVAVVFLALAFVTALMMSKAAKNQESVRTLLTQFGSLAVPFAGLSVVAILAGIAGSTVFTMLLLGISYSLFLFFVPVLFVYEKANLVSGNGQKVYLSLASVLVMTLLTFLTSGLILSDLIDSITRSLAFF